MVPRIAGGLTSEDNLAQACVGCSLRKGARQRAGDPQTGADVPLFNPRRDAWAEHFRWNGPTRRPLTDGAATAAPLAMNRTLMVATREEEMMLGRHPDA